MASPDANEVWKTVKGFEDYEVSNLGRVRNVDTGLEVKPSDNGIGYQRVSLKANGRRVSMYVHRAVATAFIANPNRYPTVNHKNLHRSDNGVQNLEWCSYQQNNLHGRHFGSVQKSRQGIRGLTNEEAARVRAMYDDKIASQRELARQFGTHQRVIWNIVNNRTYNPMVPQ